MIRMHMFCVKNAFVLGRNAFFWFRSRGVSTLCPRPSYHPMKCWITPLYGFSPHVIHHAHSMAYTIDTSSLSHPGTFAYVRLSDGKRHMKQIACLLQSDRRRHHASQSAPRSHLSVMLSDRSFAVMHCPGASNKSYLVIPEIRPWFDGLDRWVWEISLQADDTL